MFFETCDRSPVEYHYHVNKKKHTYDNIIGPIDKLIFHLHKNVDWTKEESKEKMLIQKLELLKTELMDMYENELCEEELR